MQERLRHLMENYRGKGSIGVAVSLALKERTLGRGKMLQKGLFCWDGSGNRLPNSFPPESNLKIFSRG